MLKDFKLECFSKEKHGKLAKLFTKQTADRFRSPGAHQCGVLQRTTQLLSDPAYRYRIEM